TALHRAVQNGCLELVQALLDAGADVNCADKSKWTPLIFAACVSASPECVRLLIERGADVNAIGPDGKTAFHFTCWHGIGEMAKTLLQAGADLNAADDAGNTALLLAVSSAHDQVVEWLLNSGSDINRRNRAGKTATDVAEKELSSPYAAEIRTPRLERIIELLKKAGTRR